MKIIQAINTMIENEKKISNVIQTETELFFTYNDKYKWSLVNNDNNPKEIFLHFYAKDKRSIEELSNIKDWSSQNYVTYKVSDFKTQEAFESFNELLQIVKSKIFGVDELLDDLISGD